MAGLALKARLPGQPGFLFMLFTHSSKLVGFTWWSRPVLGPQSAVTVTLSNEM